MPVRLAGSGVFQGAFLDVVDAPFNLALASGYVRLGRQDSNGVVLAEGVHLGIELRFEPIGFTDRSAQAVQDQSLRNAVEMPEDAFQAAPSWRKSLSSDAPVFAVTPPIIEIEGEPNLGAR
jgi:hypothetical protein